MFSPYCGATSKDLPASADVTRPESVPAHLVSQLGCSCGVSMAVVAAGGANDAHTTSAPGGMTSWPAATWMGDAGSRCESSARAEAQRASGEDDVKP